MSESIPPCYRLGHLIEPLRDEVRAFASEVHPLREQVRWHWEDQDHELDPKWWGASFSFVFRGLPCVIETSNKPGRMGVPGRPCTRLAVLRTPRPGYTHAHTAAIEDWQATVLPGELVCRSGDLRALRTAGFRSDSLAFVLDHPEAVLESLESFLAARWRVLQPGNLPDSLYADSSLMTVYLGVFGCWDTRTATRSMLGTATDFTYGDRTLRVTERFGRLRTFQPLFGPTKTEGAAYEPSETTKRFAQWACLRKRALIEDLPAFVPTAEK